MWSYGLTLAAGRTNKSSAATQVTSCPIRDERTAGPKETSVWMRFIEYKKFGQEK